MTYTPSLLVHILGGTVGVVSGFAALLSGKGSRFHRASGDVFVVSMLFMAALGAEIAFVKFQPFNVLAGTLTIYLVSSAWLTVKRKPGQTGRAEWALMLIAIALAASSLILRFSGGQVGYLVFAVIALLFTASDIRMLIRGGVSGAQRLARHLWRMGLALFVATGSFFLGTSGDPVLRKTGLRATIFTKAVRATHLPELPVVIVAVMTLYWLWRVRFPKGRKPSGGSTLPVSRTEGDSLRAVVPVTSRQ